MMRHTTWKGHAAMASAGILWGVMSPVCKWVICDAQISAATLAVLRIWGAAALFWLAALVSPKERLRRGDGKKMMLAALCGVLLNQGAFTFGVGLTSPSDAALVTTTLPVFTLLLSFLFLKERISVGKMIGVLASTAGAAILIVSNASGSSHGNVWGDLLCMGAQMSAACYFVFFRRQIARYSPITMMKWMFLYAAVYSSPFAAYDLSQSPLAETSLQAWGGIAYVIAVATFVCYILMPIAQRFLRPTVVSMYNYLQPIVATSLAIVWGMDRLSWTKFFSVALIFGGVFLVTTAPSRKGEPRVRKREQTPDPHRPQVP